MPAFWRETLTYPVELTPPQDATPTSTGSVEGVWYELTIEGDDQLGWVVATATRQDICARGVSGAVCV